MHSTPLLELIFLFFFFNDTATTEIYTLSLHDALPIYPVGPPVLTPSAAKEKPARMRARRQDCPPHAGRSEEHTSELQSQSNIVCRLLLEKKKSSPRTCITPRIRNTHPTRVRTQTATLD